MKVNKKGRVKKFNFGDIELTLLEESFCQAYCDYSNQTTFGNGTQSYYATYHEGMTDEKERQQIFGTTKTKAWKMLKNDRVINRIRTLLKIDTDVPVDIELHKVIRQDNDLSSKVAAIREYNKLLKRIEEKDVNIIIPNAKIVSFADYKETKGNVKKNKNEN